MRRALAVLIVPLALAAGPATASAESRVGVDRNTFIRVALEGKALTVSLTPRRLRDHRRGEDPIQGKRVQVGCGTRFRFRRGTVVLASARWPSAAESARFAFARDISRRARWCAVETPGGADHAAVSFIRPERPRFIAKGRGPGGEWWRMAGGRGDFLQPCLVARFRMEAGEQCFDAFAEREAGLGFAVTIPTCESDVFVYGVTSLATARVRVRARGAPPVEVATRPRPNGSRVQARFFMAALPRGSVVQGLAGLDADGATVGRSRSPEGSSEPDC
jgi:hypothetical protein